MKNPALRIALISEHAAAVHRQPGMRVRHLEAGPPRFVPKEGLLQHVVASCPQGQADLLRLYGAAPDRIAQVPSRLAAARRAAAGAGGLR